MAGKHSIWRQIALVLGLGLSGHAAEERVASPTPRFHAAVTAPGKPVSAPLRFNERTGLLLVTGEVNRVAAVLVVDTGASHTVLTPAFAARAGLKSEAGDIGLDGHTNLGTNRVGTVRVPALRVAGAEWGAFDAIALDLTSLADTLREPVDGILGMNTLRALPVEIDLTAPTLRFPSRAELPATAPTPSHVEGGRVMLRATVDGRRIDLLLDTGASVSHLREDFHRGPVLADGALPVVDVRGFRRETPPRVAAPRLVELGDLRLTHTRFRLGDGECILGLDALAGHRVVIDPGLQRVWIVP